MKEVASMSRNLMILMLLCIIGSYYVSFCKGVTQIIVKEETKVDLPCVFNTSATKCFWSRDGNNIDVESFPEQFNLYGKKSERNCSMQILNASIENSDGIWSCGIPISSESKFGESNVVAKVTVLSYPKSINIFYSNETNPRINASFVKVHEGIQNFKCITRYSNPKTEIIWFLEKRQMQGSNSSLEKEHNKTLSTTNCLKLNLTMKHHKMNLKCVSRFQSDENDTYVVLDVNYETTFVHITSGNIVTARKGDIVTLQCEADGNPSPNYQWFHRSSNQPIEISRESIVSFEASEAMQGQFYCQAGNAKYMIPSSDITLKVVEFQDSSLVVPIVAGSVSSVLVALGLIIIFVIYLRRKKIKEFEEIEKSVSQIVAQRKFSSSKDTCGATERVESKLQTDREGYLVTRDLNKYIPPDPITPMDVSTPNRSSSSRQDSPLYYEPHIYENIWKPKETIQIDHETNECSA